MANSPLYKFLAPLYNYSNELNYRATQTQPIFFQNVPIKKVPIKIYLDKIKQVVNHHLPLSGERILYLCATIYSPINSY